MWLAHQAQALAQLVKAISVFSAFAGRENVLEAMDRIKKLGVTKKSQLNSQLALFLY